MASVSNFHGTFSDSSQPCEQIKTILVHFAGSRQKHFWYVSFHVDAVHALVGRDQAGAVHRVYGPHRANIQGQDSDHPDATDYSF